MKMWCVLVAMMLGSALPASATVCYYYKDLPEVLRQHRDAGDKELYETQGTMVIPKAVGGCSVDTCAGWVKCDNGRGRPVIKTKVGCEAKAGKCPTASQCADDQKVIVSFSDFKVAEKLGTSTRGVAPAPFETGGKE